MSLRNLISAVAILSLFLTGGIRHDMLAASNDSFHSIGMNLRPAYIMPTHGFYNGWNPCGRPLRAGGTADMQFSVSPCGKGVYHGAGVAVHTFGADNLLGTPFTFYVFQGAPLVKLAENLALGYEWNLGVSAGWRDNGAVTVSPVNIYINVAALFTWRINERWDMVFGPEYTHFSNGDTRFPNGGANTISLRVGSRWHFEPVRTLDTEAVFMADLEKKGFSDRMSYDIVLMGGFRADRSISGGELHIFNRPFATASINFNPRYRFNSYLSAGPSLDILYDRSANLQVYVDGYGIGRYDYPDFLTQTSIGLSARAELQLPVFAVNIGIGYGTHLGDHTRLENSDLNGLYGIFALKAFLSERLFLNVSYRLSTVQYSHNLLLGIGWRFGNIISHP